MKVFGQLENASLEQLSSDPVASVAGRIYDNTTSLKVMHDNGSNKRALFRNDEKLVVGNDVTPANNVRIHKSVGAILQDVPGNDTTLDGVAATTLAQRSVRDENQLNAGLPANGNIGRTVYVTDQQVAAVDDGSNWRRLIPEFIANDATAAGNTLAAITSSVVRLTGAIATIQMIPAGFNGQRATLINRSGGDMVLSNASGVTPANQILTGTGANEVLKNNASIGVQYDTVSQKWQVIGQAAGATGSPGVPNSSVITVTGVQGGTSYSVLVTDDVVICDTSLGPITLALPAAAGNIGKRFLIEKVGSWAKNAVSITGGLTSSFGAVTTEVIYANDAPLLAMSDGSVWRTVGAAQGTVVLAPGATITHLAAVTTGNQSLETLANGTIIDNITLKTGNRILLKNQTVTEENGVYIVPASAISIAATANVNVTLASIFNGQSVPTSGGPVFVSTGQKVSLRFQSTASENGIYVVGATTGTTIRDTSQRDSSFLTAAAMRDFLGFADWYNFPTGSVLTANSPTQTSSSHTNDGLWWRQTNDNAVLFADMAMSSANQTLNIPIPVNANGYHLDIQPFGGAGGGGNQATTGGGSGGSAVPFFVSRRFTNNVSAGVRGTISVNLPHRAAGGAGNGGTRTVNGASVSLTIQEALFGTLNVTVVGAASGQGTASALSTSGGVGGGQYSAGSAGGFSSFYGSGGGPGSGSGPGQGGSAGAGNGGTGGNGTAIANNNGNNGTDGVGDGSGGGGGGSAPATGRPGRGGFGGKGQVVIRWF